MYIKLKSAVFTNEFTLFPSPNGVDVYQIIKHVQECRRKETFPSPNGVDVYQIKDNKLWKNN